MKYFSPSYWFKLWVLSAPLFNDKTQGINAKSIDNNQKIKDWASNNTTNLLLIENKELTLSNNQTYILNQQVTNQNIEPIYQTNLETSTHKHLHEKSKNRFKRGWDYHGNLIEHYAKGYTHQDTSFERIIYCSFKPEFWEEVENLKAKNEGIEKFSERFTNKVFNGVWIDWRIESREWIKEVGETIYSNFPTISEKWTTSDKNQRIRIVIDIDISDFSSYFHDVGWRWKLNYVNIRTDDPYYPNRYLDNLQRDFPIWNSYITINLGLINNNIDYDIRHAIKQKYHNFDVNQISIVDKIDYSHFTKSFSAKAYISGDCQYSHGKTKPTFSYITQTKLNEISNIIANHNLNKQWLKHISEWKNKTLPSKISELKVDIQHLKDTYPLGENLDKKIKIKKDAFKNHEKETIKSYIRDWSQISTSIEHELKLDELNKNVQGLKSSFETIKKQVNELDKRITDLENTSNWNCANIATITAGVVSVIPVINTIGGAVATVTAGACAIAGV